MAIPVQTKTNHHVGNVIEDIAMSMRSEDFAHIASVLNNLYSDPIAAVVREYSTNAWDSHVMAGYDRPIEISLPSAERLEFVVQDYGLGLNVDDLRNIYAMYGASNKRHTNDVAGMLGLGSKSGLSYAEAFTIVAVKGGVKTVAMSTKDEHGVGVIKVLDTVGTDEPNGVRITIPVERHDVDDFHYAAHNIFQFWEPGTVLIDGEAPELPKWRATALRLDEWDHTFLVRNDAGLDRSYVIMGNVGYPVPDADVGRSSYRFVARLNIGDVSIPPSREEVQFTPHTKATLSDLTDYIRATYKRAIATALANTTSRWDETVLKVLWMDRGMVIRSSVGDPIWEYTPRGYGHRKAKASPSYRPGQLGNPDLIVITGFPSKSLSASARERLMTFKPSVERYQTFIVFPKTAPTAMLDGRPNTYSWEDVIGSTAAPVKAARAKQTKVETRYSLAGSSGQTMTAAELAEVTGKVLYVEPGDYLRHGNLGATVVALRSSNQIARLKRFVPTIEHYDEEVSRQRKAAAAAVTKMDRRILEARTLPEVFHKFAPNVVDDPELAAVLHLLKAQDTATMTEAARFGVAIEHKNIAAKFNKRYPLLGAVGYYSHRVTNDKASLADALLYVNSKFDALTAP